MSAPIRRGKGKIKPPRTLIASDTRNQETWRQLSANILEIQNHNAARLSFEENYRFAYNMVSQKQGKALYEGTKALVAQNLDKLAKLHIVPTFPMNSAMTSAGEEGNTIQDTTEGEQLLKAFRFVWDDHTSSMSKLRDILKYMDRIHSQAEGVPQIWEAGLQLFIDRIIKSPIYSIGQHILSAVLRQIRLERDGFPVNRSAIKGCIEVYRSLTDADGQNVYKKELESHILTETGAYYKREGSNAIATCNAPEYLARAENRLQSEHERAAHYFRVTEEPIVRLLKLHLLTPHLQAILGMPGSGLDNMIDKFASAGAGSSGAAAGVAHVGDVHGRGGEEDLSRLYALFTLVPEGLPVLKKALKDSIAERGRAVNEAEGSSGDVDVLDDEDAPNPLLAETTTTATKSAKGKGKERADDSNPSASAEPQLAKEKVGASAAGLSAGPPGKKTLDAALKWVQDVLDLKDVFDRLLKGCFRDDKGVQTAMNEAFESFINLHPKAPEFISLFIDENLKKGLKGKSDTEVDATLEKTITVFRFITDKDIFERYYKTHLAKRLLTGRSVSDDAEKGMLAKLKVECGFQFTQKLEGMFLDMKISNDTMKDWGKHLEKAVSDPPPIDISVQVLTSTFWPMSHVPAPCTFAPDMLASCAAFERFYLSRHSGRRLSWQPSLGNADVRVTFRGSGGKDKGGDEEGKGKGKERTKDLNVSTYALVVLLLFESLGPQDFLTFEEIKEATAIPVAELSRNLQSLACAKFKILKKHPPGRDVNPDDSFSFNDDFTSPLQRIKISTVSAKSGVESGDQLKDTKDKVDEERKFQTEACIVRIMKDRKKMAHNDLINEVTRQLTSRFLPNPLAIKKRIEALLDREYLDRGEDKKSYVYVA